MHMKIKKSDKKEGLLSTKGPETEVQAIQDVEMHAEEAEEELDMETRLAVMKEYMDQQKIREKKIQEDTRAEAAARLAKERSKMTEEVVQLKTKLAQQQKGAAEMTEKMQKEIRQQCQQVERVKAKGAKPKSGSCKEPESPESFSLVSSISLQRETSPRRSEEPTRRRSKRPRRSMQGTAAENAPIQLEEISSGSS